MNSALDALLQANRPLLVAYSMKELLRLFREKDDFDTVTKFLKVWCRDAMQPSYPEALIIRMNRKQPSCLLPSIIASSAAQHGFDPLDIRRKIHFRRIVLGLHHPNGITVFQGA